VRKRDVLVQFWLDRKEAERLACMVARSGITRSAYLRQLIGGVVPADRPPPDYFAMMRELHSIGNNLNQIARRAHVSGSADEARYDRNVARLDEAIGRITEAVVLPRRI
jgi:peptide subunit release factor 1 (eRF1)